MTRFNEAIDQAIAESLAQYAREVESVRDRFLAVLGHDLRSPLAAVLTSSRFLLDEGGLPEPQKKMIASIERSGQRMNRLVDDLLDLALTRFGGLIPLRRTETDLAALVRDAAAELGAASTTTRIEVETNGNLTGEWDSSRLAQAVTNLLSNAIQYGEHGKPIKVTASGKEDGAVTVSVTNEGHAIPRDRIAGLFGAMKRGDRERVDRHLGLGLYIVDKIVQAHGGRIDVSSSEEHGTTFRITIPRHATPGAKPPLENRSTASVHHSA